MKNYLQTIVSICVLTGMVVGGVNYFAKADELQLVSMRLDQKIISDQIDQIQRRLWQLEDRHKGTDYRGWPTDDRNEYRRLKEQAERLKQKYERLLRK